MTFRKIDKPTTQIEAANGCVRLSLLDDSGEAFVTWEMDPNKAIELLAALADAIPKAQRQTFNPQT